MFNQMHEGLGTNKLNFDGFIVIYDLTAIV